jgi:heat shock protein HslJ
MFRFFFLLCATVLLTACESVPPAPPPVAELTLPVLKNLAYQVPELVGSPVTLQDGHWRGGQTPATTDASGSLVPPDADPGPEPSVHLLADFMARGQVSGDAQEEAVVLLDQWSGDTGLFTYLAVVSGEGGQPQNVSTVLLGDLVQVRDVRIEQGMVAVDLVNAGPDDDVCCPSQRVTLRWQWRDGRLQPVDSTVEGGKLSAADIATQEWALGFWAEGDPAPTVAPLTLAFQDGQFKGFAGCNRYFATVLDGQLPGELLVTQPGLTRMACPEAETATETRFLSLLGKVNRFAFAPRSLVLTYNLDDNTAGSLYFYVAGDVAPAPPVAPPVERQSLERPTFEREVPQQHHGYDVYGF